MIYFSNVVRGEYPVVINNTFSSFSRKGLRNGIFMTSLSFYIGIVDPLKSLFQAGEPQDD